MPGEPKRVQPSPDTDRKNTNVSDENGDSTSNAIPSVALLLCDARISAQG
jgi:hypothetical protein